jgi:hypothetical protein
MRLLQRAAESGGHFAKKAPLVTKAASSLFFLLNFVINFLCPSVAHSFNVKSSHLSFDCAISRTIFFAVKKTVFFSPKNDMNSREHDSYKQNNKQKKKKRNLGEKI